jgi:hypothetical protein
MTDWNDINSFFDMTVIADGRTTHYRFGNDDENEPNMMENRFAYTYTDSNNATGYVSLAENTIGHAIAAMARNETWGFSDVSARWHGMVAERLPIDQQQLSVAQLMPLIIAELYLPLYITLTSVPSIIQ